MRSPRKIHLVLTVLALGSGAVDPGPRAAAALQQEPVPQFQVDPLWPNPLPNQWIIRGWRLVATRICRVPDRPVVAG